MKEVFIMVVFNWVESNRKIENVIYDEMVLVGDGWMYEFKLG